MKKIFILILATLIFASCEPTTGSTVVVPVRDQVETIIVDGAVKYYGTSYDTLDAFKAIIEKALSAEGFELEADPVEVDGVFYVVDVEDSGNSNMSWGIGSKGAGDILKEHDFLYMVHVLINDGRSGYSTSIYKAVNEGYEAVDVLFGIEVSGETATGIKPKDPTN